MGNIIQEDRHQDIIDLISKEHPGRIYTLDCRQGDRNTGYIFEPCGIYFSFESAMKHCHCSELLGYESENYRLDLLERESDGEANWLGRFYFRVCLDQKPKLYDKILGRKI